MRERPSARVQCSTEVFFYRIHRNGRNQKKTRAALSGQMFQTAKIKLHEIDQKALTIAPVREAKPHAPGWMWQRNPRSAWLTMSRSSGAPGVWGETPCLVCHDPPA